MMTNVAQINIRKGATVWVGSDEFIVLEIEDLSQVVARNIATGDIKTLSISSLTGAPVENDASSVDQDLLEIPADDIKEAKRRLEIIRPLLGRSKHGSATAVKGNRIIPSVVNQISPPGCD